MSPHKRKRDTSTTSACYKRPRSDESSSPPPPERRLYNSEARDRPTQHAPSDFTYGQRVAVPELDGLHVDHDQDDETREQSEAVLAYLHSVRDERSAIPTLLTAPSKIEEEDYEVYNNGVGDTRGRFVKGVYIAAATCGPLRPPPSLSPQTAYRTRLISRFNAHRRRLESIPPASAVAALPSADAISAAGWKALLNTCEPHPVQVAMMDQSIILRLLRLVKRTLYRNTNLTPAKSAWIFSLLAKLGDVGTLDNDAVSVVRELGKKAVWVLCGFGAKATADATEDLIEASDASANEEPDRTRRNTSSPPPDVSEEQDVPEIPDANTRATLDMIISVVGECYGQRDLLQFREEWDN